MRDSIDNQRLQEFNREAKNILSTLHKLNNKVVTTKENELKARLRRNLSTD